jgi:hypothetical protein
MEFKPLCIFDVTKNNILNLKADPSRAETIDMPATLQLTDAQLVLGECQL